jgi:hypothetical protein
MAFPWAFYMGLVSFSTASTIAGSLLLKLGFKTAILGIHHPRDSKSTFDIVGIRNQHYMALLRVT